MSHSGGDRRGNVDGDYVSYPILMFLAIIRIMVKIVIVGISTIVIMEKSCHYYCYYYIEELAWDVAKGGHGVMNCVGKNE